MDDFLGKLPRKSSLQGETSVQVLLNRGTVKTTAGELRFSHFLQFFDLLFLWPSGLRYLMQSAPKVTDSLTKS